jgi:cytochrome P450
MFIGMDSPKHDRLFQRGFTPKRIAEQEDEIRAITVAVLDRLADRETCDLVTDVAQPVVSRVIGSFVELPTYCSAMRALMDNPDERELLLDDPGLIPSAVEESLRMFPAFSHFRRTSTRDTDLNDVRIREGDKVVT